MTRSWGPPRKVDHQTGSNPAYARAIAAALTGVATSSRRGVSTHKIGGDTFLRVDEHDDSVVVDGQTIVLRTFREWRRIYPAELAFEMRRVRGEGDLWIVENSIKYGDGPWQPTVNILEFRGDKIAHESIYITDTWDPPEWRAPWRAAR